MKIRLIEPKATSLTVFDRTLLPRLGLPLLGRLLADAGHDVRIYVETVTPVDWSDVSNAELVGLSATTATLPVAFSIAGRLRQLGIPTVIGGSHVTFEPDEALEHCDFVVRGEGQRAIFELIDALQSGRGFKNILGLSYRNRAGEVVHTPERRNCPEEEYAALPWPDLRLIVGHERIKTVPIMTQWGCPFACDFCSVIRMFGRGVRARPVEDVLDELESYRGWGSVFFYDDNFVVSKERTRRLLQGMIERGLTTFWSAQMRAEVVYKDGKRREFDHELLELMHQSGCGIVYCGFESVNPETLAAYNKHQGLNEIRDSVEAFHQHGIKVHGMFALGADTDDKSVFRRTADFSLANGIDSVQYLMITPVPGTPFWDRMTAEGRVLTADWSLYDGLHCVTIPKQMTPYELQMGILQATARFYSGRRAIWDLVRTVTMNLPFLLSLGWRELRPQLPRLAALALVPSRRKEALATIQQTVTDDTWRKLQGMLFRPVIRIYGWQHLREWMSSKTSRAYLEALRRLGPLARPKKADASPSA